MLIECGNRFRADPAMVNHQVFRRVLAHKILIASQESVAGNAALIPDQHYPAIRSKNAPEFPAGLLRLKPMKRLSRRDHIDATIRQPGPLRLASDTRESGISGEKFFPSAPHLRVRLHSGNLAAELQEQLRQQTGSGPYVGNP